MQKPRAMKKMIKAIRVPACLLFMLCAEQCNKDSEPLNINLHDQPLSVIQSYTQGSWKLQYQKSGYCGGCIIYAHSNTFNLYMDLDSERVIFKSQDEVTIDTPITWTYLNVFYDSTYVFNFSDPQGIPYSFGAQGIYNDTLMLYQPTPDGTVFYYTKLN